MLPALLAVLLVLLMAAQFLLPPDHPDGLDLPPAAATSAVVRPAGETTIDPILTRRSIFQPTRQASSSIVGANGQAAPLDGAVPAGTVRVRGAARLILQAADGRTVTLRPGQSYRGWRLIGFGSDSARFRRGGETITLGLGSASGSSYPTYGPPSFNSQGYDGGYSANQADER